MEKKEKEKFIQDYNILGKLKKYEILCSKLNDNNLLYFF